MLVGLVALASLSVAAAHWWTTQAPVAQDTASAIITSPAESTSLAVAASVESSTPVTVAADPIADAAPGSLATLLDATGNVDVSLELSFGGAHQTLHRSDLVSLVVLDSGHAKTDVVEGARARL